MHYMNIKRVQSLMSKRKRNIGHSSQRKIFELRLFRAPLCVTVGGKKEKKNPGQDNSECFHDFHQSNLVEAQTFSIATTSN